MSKTAFVEKLADRHGITKAEARRSVELVFTEIEHGLADSQAEGKYTIGTFGVFTITRRKARKGNNPRTGEPIEIKAGNVLRFRPSAQLKKSAGC